jgi:hypothetical protein
MEHALIHKRKVTMSGTTVPYQIVIFTHQHSINGGIFLHEQRFSDFLNDRRDTNVVLRNATVARLQNPAKVLEKTNFSVIPKEAIVLAFEPPQPTPQARRNYIKYPKEKYAVYLILDGMEVRGDLHVQGSLDLLHVLTDASHFFLPITNATVTIEANPNFLLKREAILVRSHNIRFIGELKPKDSQTEPRTPPSTGD